MQIGAKRAKKFVHCISTGASILHTTVGGWVEGGWGKDLWPRGRVASPPPLFLTVFDFCPFLCVLAAGKIALAARLILVTQEVSKSLGRWVTQLIWGLEFRQLVQGFFFANLFFSFPLW